MKSTCFAKVQRFTSALLACLVCWGIAGTGHAANQVEFPKTIPACPADYLTDGILASDGSIWVASEGKGLYRYFPGKSSTSKEAWLEGTYYTGLPDTVNFYALAEDKQGRIWAGTDNKGVAVFNGETWKVYDRENALIGERVFDIAVSPKTGDVAVATSAGISVYDPSKASWLDLTRAEGLAEDQIKSLSYDIAGDLWIAYACGGVSQLSGKENYKVLQTVQAPWYWDEKSGARQPLEASGNGLPSNLCNAILPLANGGVVAGTSSGIGWMTNRKNGKWNFLRGKDYHDKNKGLLNPPASVNAPQGQTSSLLPEDYVTSLAASKQGLWVGFREKGAVLLDPSTMKKKGEGKFPENIKSPWVTSMLTLPNGAVYATTYGFSLVKIAEGEGNGSASMKVVEAAKSPDHPQIAKILSEEEIAQELEQRDQQFKADDQTSVVFWKEDWATQGDWCERYGTHKGVLCATDPPRNDEVTSSVNIDIQGKAGDYKQMDESLYLRFFQGDIADDLNILYNPNTGTRVGAQWIVKKQENQMKFRDGSDIWIIIDIPEGEEVYEAALYFYDYGQRDIGHQGYKDYLIEIREGKKYLSNKIDENSKLSDSMNTAVLARTRVTDFNKNGVYKSFLLKNGSRYYFRIANNYSPLAMLNGIFINQLDSSTGKPKSTNQLMRVAYGLLPPKPFRISKKENKENIQLVNMWEKSTKPVFSKEFLSFSKKYQNSLYRNAKSNQKALPITSNWKWFLRFWDTSDHDTFAKFMEKCWSSKQDIYLNTRSEEFFPYSPGVIPFSPKEIEIMKYMQIDWKTYQPNSNIKPEINQMELKEKISRMSNEDYKKLKNTYFDNLPTSEKK